MYDTVRTPVVAALLCSIYDAKLPIPTTEFELYQKRFELLISRWNEVKEVPPLTPAERVRYQHFLMVLAFEMHREQKRELSKDGVLKFASQVFPEGLEQSPHEMFVNCVYLGLLEREAKNHYSFGHLTYQEYFAGCYIASNNDVEFVYSNLHDPWWDKAINFLRLCSWFNFSLNQINL